MRRYGVGGGTMTVLDVTYHAMYRRLCFAHAETYFETMHGGISLAVP